MLKLVVNNTDIQKEGFKISQLTCRDCYYFDDIENECGIFHGVDIDSPKTPSRCSEWTHEEPAGIDVDPFPVQNNKKEDDVMKKTTYTVLSESEDEDDVVLTEEEFISSTFQGDHLEKDEDLYPHQSIISPQRDDVYWYVHPDHSFGCWVLNQSKRAFHIVNHHRLPDGVSYRSHVPLHDHGTKGTFKHHVCWRVDEKGIGKYGLLINGKFKSN